MALRNSFLETVPSPSSSQSRNKSMTRTAFAESASRNCSWTGRAFGPSSRSIPCMTVLTFVSSVRSAMSPCWSLTDLRGSSLRDMKCGENFCVQAATEEAVTTRSSKKLISKFEHALVGIPSHFGRVTSSAARSAIWPSSHLCRSLLKRGWMAP